MIIRFILGFFLLIHAGNAHSQDFYSQMSVNDERKIPIIMYGRKHITLVQKSLNHDLGKGRRIVQYEAYELPTLRISVVSEIFHLAGTPVFQHQVELSSSVRLKEDLTVIFPVSSLERHENFTFPLKNGIIGNRKELAGERIAGAPVNPKSTNRILPFPLCLSKTETTKRM